MLEVYIVFSVFFMLIAFIAAIILSFVYLTDRHDQEHYTVIRQTARHMLLAYACIGLAWTWPLTIPLVVLYLLLSAAKDAV